MRSVVFAPLAEADLEEIWRFSVDQWGEKQADAYISTIVAAAGSIAEHPQRGVACDHIRAGYRKASAGAHVLLYRVVAAQIEIIRVLHRRMDWESRL
ncbi:MAG: type II toxin-antitoxin system RelE/ParE family toxin [Rhodospirillales bacterium]|nr:type II toxin-antitoxin system RelE/ParE family toxin [Rhodospirillales bacterium]